MALTGCQAVEEIYKNGEFHTQEFSENYYRFVPPKYLSENYERREVNLQAGDVKFSTPFQNAYTDIILSDMGPNFTLEDAIELYGSESVKAIKESDYASQVEYVYAVNEALASPSNFEANWFSYAKHNSLSTGEYFPESIRKGFKQGIFSKLTDTLIVCNGDGSLVRMQIGEEGMGQTFSHELINYRNFVISARGGTDIDYRTLGLSNVTRAKIRLDLSFFIEKSTTSPAIKYVVSYEVPDLNVDDNSVTTVMSMDLSTLLPKEALKRVNGMTINFELLEHDYLMPGGVKDDSVTGEFALMLYEVMFPHSVWR